jgi:hypothetical protein
MTPSLHQSIKNLYKVFADVPRPAIIEGCPCCIERKGVDVLLSNPLSELSPEDLTSYASSVFLTVGSVHDYFYLLPRILEILVTENGWWPDPEVVGRTIFESGFAKWPEPKKQAVIRYFEAVITAFPSGNETGDNLDTWLCTIARAQIPLDNFLILIGENDLRFEQFYLNRFETSFWSDAFQAQTQVVAWLASDKIQSIVNRLELAH